MDIKSYAKINLSLKILGTLDDGYHELDMINLPLELHDVIEISKIYSNDTYITCDDFRLMSAKANLCKKATDALRKACGFKENFLIHIHKEIPFAAGLGGGSSNAAAVLIALNKMLKLNLSDEQLCDIGLTIGADVPFFIHNIPSRVGGIGEKNEPIKLLKPFYVLIVKPEEGLSTKEVYSNYKGESIRIDTEGVIKGLETADENLIARSIGNDLMPPAVYLLPKVGEIYSSLVKDGFKIVSMSGSGSSLFAMSFDLKKMKEAQKKYEKLGYISVLTKTLMGGANK